MRVRLGHDVDFSNFYVTDARARNGRHEPVTIVRGSRTSATVRVDDADTAAWSITLSPESTAEADEETVRATFSITNGKTFAEDQTITPVYTRHGDEGNRLHRRERRAGAAVGSGLGRSRHPDREQPRGESEETVEVDR